MDLATVQPTHHCATDGHWDEGGSSRSMGGSENTREEAVDYNAGSGHQCPMLSSCIPNLLVKLFPSHSYRRRSCLPQCVTTPLTYNSIRMDALWLCLLHAHGTYRPRAPNTFLPWLHRRSLLCAGSLTSWSSPIIVGQGKEMGWWFVVTSARERTRDDSLGGGLPRHFTGQCPCMCLTTGHTSPCHFHEFFLFDSEKWEEEGRHSLGNMKIQVPADEPNDVKV
jgi:hypothetical protein